MFSHAHAFRPGFALPKAAINALRNLRATQSPRGDASVAKLDPRLRDDLGLTEKTPRTPERPAV